MDRRRPRRVAQLLLATRVEPQLGRDRPEIIYHYPAIAGVAGEDRRDDDGYDVAERFELYYRGIELANGYHELTDAAELRRRFEAVNAARVADGRRALPMPESLLAAMEHGLPRLHRRRTGLRPARDAGDRGRIDRRSHGISADSVSQLI